MINFKLVTSHRLNFSQGTGTIWLDDLQCTSSDLMLSTCLHRGFRKENCDHSEDVAVLCSHSTNGKVHNHSEEKIVYVCGWVGRRGGGGKRGH